MRTPLKTGDEFIIKGKQFLLHMWHPSCFFCYKPRDKSHMRTVLIPCYICFRRELYKRGVTVHILEPGFFKTNIIDEAAIFKAIDGTFNKLSKEMKDYYGHSYPDSSKCHVT